MRTGLLHVTSSQTALLEICMSSLALPMKQTEDVHTQLGKPDHTISLVRMLPFPAPPKRCARVLKTPQPAPTHDLMTRQSCTARALQPAFTRLRLAPPGLWHPMMLCLSTAVTYNIKSGGDGLHLRMP
ncbi:hypothetical protein BDP55DRAFT_680710 [Colletotrichum godetiae]|uniref:Uncharacterized protein n=1 Tax=Colletotrichum godetiae TaxID=1209918 RepID=A0AAJ0EPY5_9PEZI|nr:uncharacterized protein BDP55DRAFT_680710 [Colletotrichum godetiae]KAK1659057.1 hypothetical protein BDP55DRAFT_680710 [Colletotrichum godetiae]